MKVLEPITIRGMEVKNRLVAAPMVHNLATPDGYVTQKLIDIYTQRARGGWGLVQVEASYIRPDGDTFRRMLGIHNERQVAGLNELAEAIQEWGVRASLQLQHAGRQARLVGTGLVPIAPSKSTPPWGGATPKELTEAEVGELADCFAQAALWAKEAGFDAVSIHGAHGFVIQQFMSPYTNHRDDKYGDKTAFLLEVIEKVRGAVGEDYPLLVRISGDEFLGDRGYTIDDTARDFAPKIQAAGIDCIDVSAGLFDSGQYIIQPIYTPRGVISHLAKRVKEVVDIPVIGVGRINDPKLAEKYVADGTMDLVAFGRGAFADPDLPRKMQDNPEDIRKCIACDFCGARLTQQFGARCAINPEMDRDASFRILRSAVKPKRVLVVGGGPAGMEAARVAALRDHEVILCEKDARLGGMVLLAAGIPRVYTRELRNIVDYLTVQVKKVGVTIRCGVEVTPDTVAQYDADAVVLAVGSRSIVPDIPGVDDSKVLTLEEYLRSPAKAGEKVVVIGGNEGAETACSLAREGKKVALVEEGPDLGATPYMHITRRIVLMGYLMSEKVELLTGTRVKGIAEGGVNVIDQSDNERMLEADTVILALGRVPNSELMRSLQGQSLELHEIGDCTQPHSIMKAIHDAARVAREL